MVEVVRRLASEWDEEEEEEEDEEEESKVNGQARGEEAVTENGGGEGVVEDLVQAAEVRAEAVGREEAGMNVQAANSAEAAYSAETANSLEEAVVMKSLEEAVVLKSREAAELVEAGVGVGGEEGEEESRVEDDSTNLPTTEHLVRKAE